jgi:hypothetical protein
MNNLNNLHQGLRSPLAPYCCLILLAVMSLAFKLSIFNLGAPYVTIDDYTLYNAGFLVWFGQAPPQRMYFESWIAGITSIATYVMQLVQSGQLNQLGLNLIADAYRAFHEDPTPFVQSYRAAMLALDMLTAWLVYQMALVVFAQQEQARWLGVFAAGLFLFSYNSIWCNIVARPDTVTALFATSGMLFYFKSAAASRMGYLYLSAIALGCATGFKLHAALFVVFVILDLLRQLGWRKAITASFPFGLVAVAVFMVVAGSPLFDPLLYVKLRALNAIDDASPWLKWGDQFATVLRGAGWITIPVYLGLGALVFSKRVQAHSEIRSLLFIALLLAAFFFCIRIMRAYWMLPALPLFYIAAGYLLVVMKDKRLKAGFILACFTIFIGQCYQQVNSFSKAQYNQLQDWVSEHVSPSAPIYIVGYDTLFLPKNTEALVNQKRVIERQLDNALADNETFTNRHVRQWEERSQLQLIDMLNVKSAKGFNYYSLNGAPMEDLQGIVDFADIQYFVVDPAYKTPAAKAIVEKLQANFSKVATVTAPGGKAGTGGLAYDIYARNP